tara:strand:+ start:1353 stop:2381 length:1029 start_codon:yes stop_codon:yes gene_type:complete
MPGIFVGNTKSLVFPMMSDAYLQLKYADKNDSASTVLGLRQGLWGHNKSFSIEAIITPYDVNGFGSKGNANNIGITDSEKTPPSVNTDNANLTHYQSQDYFTPTNRNTHKMMIFHSSGFELYLQNTTIHNFNQPAEYKLCAKIGSEIVETGKIISPRDRLYGYYDLSGFYDGISTMLKLFDDSTSITGTTVTCESTGLLIVGTEIFNSSGVSLGTVQTIDANGSDFTLTSATNYTNKLFIHQPKEAFYMDTMYKITCCVHTDGKIRLFINNILLVEGEITITDFNFGTTDCYIGRDPDTTHTQFMGELYEIAMFRTAEPSIASTTLNIGYNDTIFYYRFGDL